MTTLTGRLVTPSGAPVVGAQVSAVLRATTPFADIGDMVIRSAMATSAADGSWSLTLTPTGDLEDPGAYYEVSAGDRRYAVVVPASGTVTLRAALTDPPQPSGVVLGLTRAQADALYAPIGGGGSGGPGAGLIVDYRLTTDGAGSYTVTRAAGTVLGTYTDTATTSGLRAALTAILAEKPSYVHIHFAAGRFHFLDAPLGSETWAAVEDHMQYGTSGTRTYGLRFTGEGMDATIISNRTNFSGVTDTEPFSFTNCYGTYLGDLTVESCGAYKSTTDAIDCDQGAGVTIERVRIRRSRARGIVIDGGDPGRYAKRTRIRQCEIHGRPPQPALLPITGGALAATTLYDYCVTWVDRDLAGAGVSGETKPSDVASYTTDTTSRTVRVFVPRGSYNTTSRKVYRRSTPDGGWVLIATVAGNADSSVDDAGLASQGAAVFTDRSAIPDSGVELLGSSECWVADNDIDGTGDASVGSTQHGINVVRKSIVPTTADRNIITGNRVRKCAAHGIRVAGGSDNLVTGNHIANPGTVAVKAQALRIEGVTGAATNNNRLAGNRGLDDQGATSPAGGATMNNAVTVTATNSPSGNVVEDNILSGGASSTVISDAGTGSVIRRNKGHNPQGPAAVTVTASPMTYTAGPTPEVLYVQGGTVSAITKAGTTLASATGAVIPLEPGEAVVITYSAAPTLVRDRK